MTGPSITISCLTCGDELKTSDVQKAIAFDHEHVETCKPEAGEDS